MNILAGNEAYKLDKLVVNALGNDRQISWRYFGQSTHFLITISDAFSVFSLNDVEAYLKKQGICDEDFIAKRELSLSDENNVIRWIDIEEGLPGIGERVLLMDYDGNVSIGELGVDNKFSIEDVKYWMLIPGIK